MVLGISHSRFRPVHRQTQRSHQETIFIVQGLKNKLVGLPALTTLQVVQRVKTTYTSLADVKSEFPKVFEGLGSFREPYTIQLKEDAKSSCPIYTQKCAHTVEMVQEEFNRMESIEVISKVTELTAWCAGMFVVPKRSGDVCICVD